MAKLQKPGPKTLRKSNNADNIKKAFAKVKENGIDNAMYAKKALYVKPVKKGKRALLKQTIEDLKFANSTNKEKRLLLKKTIDKVEEDKQKKKLKAKSLAIASPENLTPAKGRLLISAPALISRKPLILAPVDTPTSVEKVPSISATPKTLTPVKPKPQKYKKTKAREVKSVATTVTVIKNNAKEQAKQNAKIMPSTKQPTDELLAKKLESNMVEELSVPQKGAKKIGEQINQQHNKHHTVFNEPTIFDEEKFKNVVNCNNIQNIVAALKKQVEEEVKKKTTSIFSDFRYILNVVSFKVANCPRRMVKLSVKHSIVGEDDDVAIIVPDLHRGAKIDYEPTIQHYEDVFREAGISGLKIVPFNKLRTEMGTYEAKHKFCNTYDYFLCDGRIVGQAHGFLGQPTQKPRTVLHAVQLRKDNKLKEEIERGLRRTAYRQLQKGDLISIPVGSHKFTEKQVVDNILYVVKQLKTIYAGGWPNIRSMHLKIDIKGTSSLPLFISTCLPPKQTPNVVGPREQRMIKLKKQVNNILSKFALTKDAKFIKLDRWQVERKRQLREAEKVVLEENNSEPQMDDDGSDTAVPTKKARKEEKVEVNLKNPADKKASAEHEEDDHDNEEEDDDLEEGSDENEDYDEDADSDENEDDDDDDEVDAEIGGGDDDDDDENEDDETEGDDEETEDDDEDKEN